MSIQHSYVLPSKVHLNINDHMNTSSIISNRSNLSSLNHIKVNDYALHLFSYGISPKIVRIPTIYLRHMLKTSRYLDSILMCGIPYHIRDLRYYYLSLLWAKCFGNWVNYFSLFYFNLKSLHCGGLWDLSIQ